VEVKLCRASVSAKRREPAHQVKEAENANAPDVFNNSASAAALSMEQ
jgi:hypothetical protein